MGWMTDETGLEKCAANHVPLTPLSFLRRAAQVFPGHELLTVGEQILVGARVPIAVGVEIAGQDVVSGAAQDRVVALVAHRRIVRVGHRRDDAFGDEEIMSLVDWAERRVPAVQGEHDWLEAQDLLYLLNNYANKLEG